MTSLRRPGPTPVSLPNEPAARWAAFWRFTGNPASNRTGIGNSDETVGDMLTAAIAEFTTDRMITGFGASIGADSDLLDQISSPITTA